MMFNSLDCPLDVRVVETEDEITAAVRDIALNAEFAAGDAIRVIDQGDES
jgi:hypothetical protein